MSYTTDLYQEISESFSPILNEKSYRKSEIIHLAGKVCQELYLVKEGILRAFYFKEDKDITAHFAFPREAITAPDSFILAKPSKYCLEALEDTTVLAVQREKLEQFLLENPEMERPTRQFTQAIYLDLLERLESMVFLSATERYELLMKRNPNLLLRVNLGLIASYLGITQETLSRIRAK
jgi:CRP-like cAMP-binding protein